MGELGKKNGIHIGMDHSNKETRCPVQCTDARLSAASKPCTDTKYDGQACNKNDCSRSWGLNSCSKFCCAEAKANKVVWAFQGKGKGTNAATMVNDMGPKSTTKTKTVCPGTCKDERLDPAAQGCVDNNYDWEGNERACTQRDCMNTHGMSKCSKFCCQDAKKNGIFQETSAVYTFGETHEWQSDAIMKCALEACKDNRPPLSEKPCENAQNWQGTGERKCSARDCKFPWGLKDCAKFCCQEGNGSTDAKCGKWQSCKFGETLKCPVGCKDTRASDDGQSGAGK